MTNKAGTGRKAPIRRTTIGNVPADIFEHFFYSLCNRAGITAPVAFSGKNDHHQCEALFKAFGIALGQALFISGDKKGIRSTKGTFKKNSFGQLMGNQSSLLLL